MKPIALIAVVCLTQAVAQAESAYEALRSFGADRGREQLNRVMEVQGRDGAPQPRSWKIVLDDPGARGGVREVEVKNGAVISEKTPVRGYSGDGANAVMDFEKLNLDSEGAFIIANREATKAQVGFDKIDYTLRGGDETPVPVWILQLIDASGENVGTVHVSADKGTVLRREGLGSREGRTDEGLGSRREGRTDEDYIPQERPVSRPRDRDADFPEDRDPEREYARASDYGYEDEQYDSDHRGVKYHIKKAFVGAGATLEQFFTGKRTLDRNYRE